MESKVVFTKLYIEVPTRKSVARGWLPMEATSRVFT